jgi:hypothetical protein
MNRVWMREWLGPKPLAPLKSEFLGKFFAREFKPNRTAFLVDALQVSEFVEEDVVEQESPDGKGRPFLTTPGAKLLARLAFYESCAQAHSRRQSAECDLPAPAVHIAQKPRATRPIVEIDGAEPIPEFFLEAA